jgi:hypothetical protein
MPKNAAISATRRRISGVGTPRLSRPKANSCQTRSVTIWLSGDCPTYPMAAACRAGGSFSTAQPSSRISPLRLPQGARAGLISRSSVVFPLPEGPQSVTNSPRPTRRDASRRAGRLWPG